LRRPVAHVVEPDRFFKPPTSATWVFSGWLGTFLDTSGVNRVDWTEVAAIMEDAYRTVAPRKLIAELDSRNESPFAGCR
jgi:hypothetical protein